MGLDIVAYSNLAEVGHTVLPYCKEDDHICVFAYDAFPRSFRGITVTQTEPGFLHGGCFRTTDATEEHHFHAGNYGGYSRWREDLQQQFNPDRSPAAPFYELIWFADNEGCIGPEAAADLLQDFREHASQYRPRADWCQRVFSDFARAAELASANGLIYFC